MSELYKIVLTSCVTLLGGIILFIVGQIVVRFFIDPIHEQRKLIRDIDDSLIFYANEYTKPGNTKSPRKDVTGKEVSRMLRQHGTQLISKTNAIPWYPLWRFLRFVRKRKDIQIAYRGLINLSNSISMGNGIENIQKSDQIKKCLGLAIKEESNEEKGRAS